MLSTVDFMMVVSNGNSFSPMAEDTVPRHRGGVIHGGDNQLAATQVLERALHGAF